MTFAVMEPATTRKAQRRWKAHTQTAGWALALGVFSGLACVGVRLSFRMLQWIFVRHTGMLPEAAATLAPLHRAMVPVVGAVLATAVLLAARRWSRGKPFVEYVEAVRFEEGFIPFESTLWRTASSALSVASGAAVGREGSMIQFAAAATSWSAARFGTGQISLARQVSYGAAAAVAAAYQAPLAGVFFALEIVLGRWAWLETGPLLLAALAGWAVSRTLLGGGPLFPVPQHLAWGGAFWSLPLAVVLGALGPVYQRMLRGLDLLRRLPAPLVWGALAVGLLSLLEPTVWGNGDVALQRTLSGVPLPASLVAVLLCRLVATMACVGAGTVGGVFTPTLFAGATLGLLAGHLLHVPQPLLLSVVGLSTLMAGVTHAPWMAAIMAVELTGQWHLLPALVVLNLVAKAIAGRLSSQSLYAIATPEPAGSGVARSL